MVPTLSNAAELLFRCLCCCWFFSISGCPLQWLLHQLVAWHANYSLSHCLYNQLKGGKTSTFLFFYSPQSKCDHCERFCGCCCCCSNRLPLKTTATLEASFQQLPNLRLPSLLLILLLPQSEPDCTHVTATAQKRPRETSRSKATKSKPTPRRTRPQILF